MPIEACFICFFQAAFLLPWRRVFNLSDSSLYVARRDNAKALFRSYIDSRGGVLQVCCYSAPNGLGPALRT